MNLSRIADQAIKENKYDVLLQNEGWDATYDIINGEQCPFMVNAIVLQMKVDELDLFEIYVCNSEDITEGVYAGKKAGEVSGWDIKWVLSTSDAIKFFPWFDEVITKNDNSTGRRDTSIIWK